MRRLILLAGPLIFLAGGCAHLDTGGSIQTDYFHSSGLGSKSQLVERGRFSVESKKDNVEMKVSGEAVNID